MSPVWVGLKVGAECDHLFFVSFVESKGPVWLVVPDALKARDERLKQVRATIARHTHTHARTTCTPHALGPGMRRLHHDLPGRLGSSGRGGGMATRCARDGFQQPRAAPAA